MPHQRYPFLLSYLLVLDVLIAVHGGGLKVTVKVFVTNFWNVIRVTDILLCLWLVHILLLGLTVHVLFSYCIIFNHAFNLFYQRFLLGIVNDGGQTLNPHGLESINLGQLGISEST